jgi:signal transduction histidine kinase
MLVAFAAANVAYLAYDALRLDPLPAAVIAGRAVVGVALVLGAFVIGRGRYGEVNRLITPIAAACLLGWFFVVAGAGGSASAYFAMVPAFPLIVAVAFPENGMGALVLSALSLAGGLALLASEGASAARLTEWGGVALFLGLSAIGSARVAWSRIVRELSAQKARAEAMENLARSEQRRAASERLAVLGQLAAGVAHEINNPLGYVKSNLGFLRTTAAASGGDPEPAEALADIVAGIDRIAQIVADLNSFSRDGSDESETCDVEGILDEALRLSSYRVQRSAAVLKKVGSVPPIRVPRRRLVQAVVNLVVNAAEALEQGAATPGRSVPPSIRVEAERDGDAVRIEVEDNGPGLDPSVKARLFEPFFTTKGNVGTGLGLAISLENVHRCGGTLGVADGTAGGARFTILIPAASRQERERRRTA